MAEGGASANTTEALLANTSMEHVRDITKCSKCQHLLQDPRTLQCLHSFCNHCLAGEDKSDQDGKTGYECSQCQRFTEEKDVRVFQLLVLLLDAHKTSKQSSNIRKCERCKTKDAKWFCTECKRVTWLCDDCKNNHDEYIDEHRVISVDKMKEEKKKLNKPQFCTKHTQNELDVVCLECETLICVRCKVDQHDVHKSESIDGALKRILPTVCQKLDKIKENVKEHRECIATIEKEKEAAIERFNKAIREHENEVSEQNQVLSWATTAMAKTTGSLLLQQFQNEFGDKIERVGTKPGFSIQASRTWPWTMNPDPPKKSSSLQLPSFGGMYPYTRIAILWDRIWMINHNTGTVYTYNFNGEKDNEFNLDGRISVPRTAVQVHSERAIIAAQSGLFLIDGKDKRILSTQPGDFSDVSFGKGGFINALEHKQGKVFRLQINNSALHNTDEIRLENYENNNTLSNGNFVNTMLVAEKSIFVSLCAAHQIMQYDISGKKLKVVRYSADSPFPHVCGLGLDNIILTTHVNGRRIEWWDENQKFKEYRIPETPWFAVYLSDKVFWVLDSDNRLHRILGWVREFMRC